MKNIVIILFCISMLLSCGGKGKKTQEPENASAAKSTSDQVDSHNAKNSLDYIGRYHGVLPTASGEGMDVCITLQDSSYVKEMLHIGKSEESIVSTGAYSWNNAGNTITLTGEEKPNQYFVGENTLIHLDIDGKKIEGDLADNYILRKE